MNNDQIDINAKLKTIYTKYPTKVQKTVRKIIEAERRKLHMGTPIGINEDIIKIIKNEER